MAKRTTKRARIAMDLVRLTIAALIAFARVIIKGLTNNPNLDASDLAKLPVSTTDLTTAVNTLEATHIARPSAPSKAATQLEGDQATALINALTDDARFIEGLANKKAANDHALARSIILSVGFQLAKDAVRAAKKFAAASVAKGSATITFPSRPQNVIVLLTWSGDGEKTWSYPIVVHNLDLTITGLKSGTEASFRYAIVKPPAKRGKQVVAAGSEEPTWGDAVTCMIR